MQEATRYATYKKPSWAPPAWIFAPVWTALYAVIAVSFGHVLVLYLKDGVPFPILLPFILNLAFNACYTPIQFRLRNFKLALIDVALVLITLAWAMAAIYPYAPWVAYANIPYLCWVTFATVLQATITWLNR